MRILGLDIGDKRIGIALSDKDKKISAPFKIIDNDSDFRSRIKNIIDEYYIEKIVIGMPYTLKGEIGRQGRKIAKFVEENIDFEGVETVYFDERFTSVIPGKNKKSKKNMIDKLSAAIILQDYLDKQREIKCND